MGLTVAEVASRLGGTVEGRAQLELRGLAGLLEAKEGDLSFLANPRYGPEMAGTHASAVIVGPDWKGTCSAAVIRVKDPDKAFARAATWFARPAIVPVPGIHATAVVAPDVRLGQGVSIGPYCVIQPGAGIGDRTVLEAGGYIGHACVVGADCHFYPHVSLREYTRVGSRVILHNGAVIGSDGFGYTNEGGAWRKIPQIGVVVIGDDVEIGANTTVDRARFGETRIENGVKIDNLVQVAHNVTIGENSAIAAQTGISGSTHVGRRVQLGGQAGLAGHLHVGDDSVVGAQAGVTKDVPPRTFVSGYPAMPHDKALKTHAHLMRLPELKARVAEIEKRIKELEPKP